MLSRSLQGASKNSFIEKNVFIIFFAAIILRILPLFWGSESFDIALYRQQAVPVLANINPYLYNTSESLTNIGHPYVYLPFSIFYAPLCWKLSVWLQAPFHVVTRIFPIFFDLAIYWAIFLFLRYVKQKNIKLALTLYALCPIAILISSFHGNVMSGPVLFMFLSFFFFERNLQLESKDSASVLRLSAIFLGCAIAWRSYPVVILPFFLIHCRSMKERFWFLIFMSLPVIATTLPIFIADPSPLIKSLNYAGIKGVVGWPVLFEVSERLFGASVVKAVPKSLASISGYLLFLTFYVFLIFDSLRNKNLLRSLVLAFLGLYLFSPSIAPQYLFWVLPFLIVYSFRWALVYVLIGGILLFERYWAVYPEIIFGRFPIPYLPVFLSDIMSAVLTLIYLFSLAIMTLSILFSGSNEPAKLMGQAERRLSMIWIEKLIYGLLTVLVIAECFFVFKIERGIDWKIVQTMDIESIAGSKQKVEETRAVPVVSFSQNYFFWFDPDKRILRIIDPMGQQKKKLVLKNPRTGTPLDISDITMDSRGALVAADWRVGFLGRYRAEDGSFIDQVAPDKIIAPTRIAVNSNGLMAVMDIGRSAIILLSGDGKIVDAYFYPFSSGKIPVESYDVGIDGVGRVYILDSVSQRVSVIGPDANTKTKFSVAVLSPHVSLTVNEDGFFWILGIDVPFIEIYSSEGKRIGRIDNDPRNAKPYLDTPCAVMIDSNEHVYIADGWKRKIYQIETNDGMTP